MTWPCKLKSGKITACQGLDEVLEMGGSGTRLQGVKLLTLIDMKTGKFSRHIVVVKSGKHSKKGIIMNNCPFCAKVLYRNAPKKKSLTSQEGQKP